MREKRYILGVHRADLCDPGAWVDAERTKGGFARDPLLSVHVAVRSTQSTFLQPVKIASL